MTLLILRDKSRRIEGSGKYIVVSINEELDGPAVIALRRAIVGPGCICSR
jgi:hypothetical protein